jgi:hypothetical protein
MAGFWLRAAPSALLVLMAVASEAIRYAGVLPSLATYRENAALWLLFASLIPWATLGAASLIWRDPPPGRQVGRVKGTFNAILVGPFLLAFGLVWVLSVISAFMLVISFVAGAPAGGDWA